MNDAVKIIECPRDAWQGLSAQIPAEQKAKYLNSLIVAGFRHIDAVSFVSPSAVPQMADSEEVLKLLGPAQDVEIIGIVVNEKGAQRAIQTGAVRTLGFPYSISPEFLRRNQHQTPEESLSTLCQIVAMARDAGLNVVAYISMAFGNPYGDPWNIGKAVDGCGELIDRGVREISLADTVGLSTPAQIADAISAVDQVFPAIEFGLHLHARRADAPSRIRAAYLAGCRRFDAAIGGLGGCPFAQDDLVGNVPTEELIATLTECGASLPELGLLDDVLQANEEIAGRFAVPAH
ncbi:MAG TPA: hydroxymethylglutaryl-CoA lyase [Terracidiphilus sp.]|nr:hydroxymethylglutaryl-CoA lyase [Terracidiphilus sp.]